MLVRSPPPGARGPPGRRQDYRSHQKCYRNEDTGDVVVKFHLTDIIRVTTNGDVILDSGGYLNAPTFHSFNDALAAIGIKFTFKVGCRSWLLSLCRSAGISFNAYRCMHHLLDLICLVLLFLILLATAIIGGQWFDYPQDVFPKMIPAGLHLIMCSWAAACKTSASFLLLPRRAT